MGELLFDLPKQFVHFRYEWSSHKAKIDHAAKGVKFTKVQKRPDAVQMVCKAGLPADICNIRKKRVTCLVEKS